MNKNWIILVSIIAIVIIVVPVGWFLNQKSEENLPGNPNNPPKDNIVFWQADIENFATGLAAKDDKVFTIDVFGNINCFDSTTGNKLWEGSVGAYDSRGLVIREDRVYGGAGAAVVGCLDIETGNTIWDLKEYMNDVKYHKNAPENFTLVDGRLFVTTEYFSAFNATNGKLLWLIKEYGHIPGDSERISLSYNWWAFENDVVIGASRGSDGSKITRLHPDNGTIIWATQGMFVEKPINFEEQIIIQNLTKTKIISLDVNSGKMLWSIDFTKPILNTIEYNGLLIFGSSDDNIYAVNLDTGTLAWKRKVADRNTTGLINNENHLEGLEFILDQQNEKLLTVFANTQTTIDEKHEVEERDYIALSCLDINNGDIIWSEFFSGEGDIPKEYRSFSGAVTENRIYLTSLDDLLIFSKNNGTFIESHHFEHRITAPVVENNIAYVSADLWVFAYD